MEGGGGVGRETLVAAGRRVDLLFERDGCEVVVKLGLLLVTDLLLEFLLIDDRLLSLLEGFLNAALHPVGIVAGGLNVLVIKLLLDVLPDLAILQEGVQLDDLHDLLLTSIKLVEVESDSVEGAKDGRPQVVVLHNLV